MMPFNTIASPDDLGYATAALDRQANRRADPVFMAACLARADARFALLAGDVPILKTGDTLSCLFDAAEAPERALAAETIFLGIATVTSAPVFALSLPAADDAGNAPVDGRTHIDLRSLASQGLLPQADLGLLAMAKSMTSWHQTHRFCSRCGAPSVAADGGWKRICVTCAGEHFPRTDPVVIMLATHGDRCLLGRQPRFPPGMYSALAGFLEPGETIEDAVRREIMEEAGVACGTVAYLGAQPWPFPMSLMIGCAVEATSDIIAIDHDELEDARWFTRAEVISMMEGTHPDGLQAPNTIAIAHHLVRAFVQAGG